MASAPKSSIDKYSHKPPKTGPIVSTNGGSKPNAPEPSGSIKVHPDPVKNYKPVGQ